MDRDSVVRHLRAWADGIDVETGAALPADHPAQQPVTLRVVFGALALLESPVLQRGSLSDGNRNFPRNAGRAWSAEDDASLVDGHDHGKTIGALANQLERTRGSITARLVKLGRIEAPPGLRLRGDGAAFGAARVGD
ncbi:MAG TPA: hypothetical protein VNE58_10215 [Casimicrobiaceae bacterium]|nr:hypothetical protein [Casimicrobiaceae bacterium]